MRSGVRRSIVALALLAGLVLSGCSDGDKTDADAEASTAAAATETLIQQGLDQLSAGDTGAATGTFEKVLTLDPANVYALYNLGVIAQQADRQAEAIDRYDAALDTDPDFTSALFNKAILLEKDDLHQAVALYRKVLKVDDQMAAAQMRLGFALLELGETEEAQQHLAAGIRLDPSMAEAEAPSYD